MQHGTLDDPIATRVLRLAVGKRRSRIVQVFIGRPRRVLKEREEYHCQYEVVGLKKRVCSYAVGEDAVQALFLALVGAGGAVSASEEAMSGRLSWLNSQRLGFPLPVSYYTFDRY